MFCRATYENHLWGLVDQHVVGVSVLLLPLGQILHNAADSPRATGNQSRSRPAQSVIDGDLTRSVVPLIRSDIPRFHTLPISMPLASRAGSELRPTAPEFDSGESTWLSTKSNSNRASRLCAAGYVCCATHRTSSLLVTVHVCAGGIRGVSSGLKSLSKLGSSLGQSIFNA